jgi:hypothetical protein
MAEVDPDQEAALRRLRAAFGLIQVLRIVDMTRGQEQDQDRTAMSFLRKTSNDRRRIGSVSAPVARGGGTPPVGAGADRAAATHRSPSSPDARPRVPLQIPRAEEPAAAALDRAAPLRPGLARVVKAEQGAGLGEADLQTRDTNQHREQALNFTEGPR